MNVFSHYFTDPISQNTQTHWAQNHANGELRFMTAIKDAKKNVCFQRVNKK